MSCQKPPPFHEQSSHLFSLSQSVFVLAHWKNTSFHASQQQCYPLKCEKGKAWEIKRIFHTDFCQDQLAAKTVNNSRCANPSIPGDLTGGTAALRNRQGSPSLSEFPCCRIWQGCNNPLMWAASALRTAWGCGSHSGQVSGQKPGQSRETTPTQPYFTEGNCIQLLTTCITYALPGHFSASGSSTPQAMLALLVQGHWLPSCHLLTREGLWLLHMLLHLRDCRLKKGKS